MTINDVVNGILGVWNEYWKAKQPESSSGTEVDWIEIGKITYKSGAEVVPMFFNLPELGKEVKGWTDEQKKAVKDNFVAKFSLQNPKHEAIGERIFDLSVELADFSYDMIAILDTGEEIKPLGDRDGLGNEPELPNRGED